MPPAPPSGAEHLLRAAVRDPEWRDAVLGDLAEEYARVGQRCGVHRARRWYWRQALAIAARVSASRLLPGGVPGVPGGRRPSTRARRSVRPGARRALRVARAPGARPSLSAVIVVTLALALAANATVFNLADALYLRPFRFPGSIGWSVVLCAEDATRWPTAARSRRPTTATGPREHDAVSFSAAADFWDPNLSDADRPSNWRAFASAHRSSARQGRTAARPHLPRRGGRTRARTAAWSCHTRSGCGGLAPTPALVGRSVRLNGEPHEVVGVMRPGPALPYGAEVWAPLAYTDEEWLERGRGLLLVLARLGEGQTLESRARSR